MGNPGSTFGCSPDSCTGYDKKSAVSEINIVASCQGCTQKVPEVSIGNCHGCTPRNFSRSVDGDPGIARPQMSRGRDEELFFTDFSPSDQLEVVSDDEPA